MAGDDVGHREDVRVGFARRRTEVERGGQVATTGGIVFHRAVVDDGPGEGAGKSDELVGLHREAEGLDAGGSGIGEGDLRDDDLDADLGEQHIEVGDDVLDQAHVVDGAGNHEGIAALVGHDGQDRAELLQGGRGGPAVRVETRDDKSAGGAGNGDRVGPRGGRLGGGLGVGGIAPRLVIGVPIGLRREGVGGVPGVGLILTVLRGQTRGGGLPRDERAEHGGHVGGVGVLQRDDLLPGAGFTRDVELGDQLVEEGVLARVGHQDDLVGAVVGLEDRARAQLGGGGAGEQTLHFGDELAGGRVLHLVEFGRQAAEGG